mmetsp:Transcript_2258/g.4786  ORF Transcript_2258/g.4786 Transcript_2258/m.4786 type:complete len:223 (-) Transcript_2258:203-871(-)
MRAFENFKEIIRFHCFFFRASRSQLLDFTHVRTYHMIFHELTTIIKFERLECRRHTICHNDLFPFPPVGCIPKIVHAQHLRTFKLSTPSPNAAPCANRIPLLTSTIVMNGSLDHNALAKRINGGTPRGHESVSSSDRRTVFKKCIPIIVFCVDARTTRSELFTTQVMNEEHWRAALMSTYGAGAHATPLMMLPLSLKICGCLTPSREPSSIPMPQATFPPKL